MKTKKGLSYLLKHRGSNPIELKSFQGIFYDNNNEISIKTIIVANKYSLQVKEPN